jgi:hypothetical protein
MKLLRKLPATGAQPQMVLYQCEQCRHTMTRPFEGE